METLSQVVSMLFGTPLIPAALIGLVWGVIGGAMPGLSASVTMALAPVSVPKPECRSAWPAAA